MSHQRLEKLKRDVFDQIDEFEDKTGLCVEKITTTHDWTLVPDPARRNREIQVKRLKTITIEVNEI